MNTLLFESAEDVIKRIDEESTPIGDIILTNTKTKKQLIIKNTAEKIEAEIDVLYETLYEEVETVNEYNNKTVNIDNDVDNVKVTTTKHNNLNIHVFEYTGKCENIEDYYDNRGMTCYEYNYNDNGNCNCKTIMTINNNKINELVNCHKKDVYVDGVFNDILKSNNYDSFYNSYDTKFKIRYDSKLHKNLIDSVYKGTYIDYNDIYPPGTKNNKIIKNSQNALITVVNRYQNEIYLIYYDNIKKRI